MPSARTGAPRKAAPLLAPDSGAWDWDVAAGATPAVARGRRSRRPLAGGICAEAPHRRLRRPSCSAFLCCFPGCGCCCDAGVTSCQLGRPRGVTGRDTRCTVDILRAGQQCPFLMGWRQARFPRVKRAGPQPPERHGGSPSVPGACW